MHVNIKIEINTGIIHISHGSILIHCRYSNEPLIIRMIYLNMDIAN